jgi:hypothetical protein
MGKRIPHIILVIALILFLIGVEGVAVMLTIS